MPEMRARSFLHSHGLRFRLHSINLPGKPDIVLKKYNTVLFVHGCFWHQHRDPRCNRSGVPKSNRNYWLPKLQRTIAVIKLDGNGRVAPFSHQHFSRPPTHSSSIWPINKRSKGVNSSFVTFCVKTFAESVKVLAHSIYLSQCESSPSTNFDNFLSEITSYFNLSDTPYSQKIIGGCP